MEPITVVALGSALLIASALSGAVGRSYGRKDIDPENLAHQVRMLRLENRTQKTKLEYREKDIDRLEKQRDKYKEIAATHKWCDDPDPNVRGVWNKRRYTNHPNDNFLNLSKDLKEFSEKHIRIQIRIVPLGGWKELFQAGYVGYLEGSPERVVEELRTILWDDDSVFIKKEKYNPPGYYFLEKTRKVWKDDDSPVRFEVDLAVVEHDPPQQVMEVAVVEEVVVEREIEKPIYVNEPEKVPCNHTREELLALLEVEEVGKHRELLSKNRRGRIVEKRNKYKEKEIGNG